MNITSKHASFRASRNGALRFVCADVFGVRVSASFCRVKVSKTTPIRFGTLSVASSIVGLSVAVIHALSLAI